MLCLEKCQSVPHFHGGSGVGLYKSKSNWCLLEILKGTHTRILFCGCTNSVKYSNISCNLLLGICLKIIRYRNYSEGAVHLHFKAVPNIEFTPLKGTTRTLACHFSLGVPLSSHVLVLHLSLFVHILNEILYISVLLNQRGEWSWENSVSKLSCAASS